MESSKALISVVVPCYNEEAVIAETHKRLMRMRSENTQYEFEFLYVDDGSRDRTLQILRSIVDQDPCARAVVFARNFGHQLAVTAGIDHAVGDAVVLIDADLQDPPEVISDMLTKWREGYEVVYGVRSDRWGESAFKLWTAHAFYRVLNGLSDTPIPLDTGDFRLMDRKVVEVLRTMPERDRFVRGLVSWIGFRQAPLPYSRAERFAGTTKYPLRKMIRFASDGIISFSTKPLQVAMLIGVLCAGLACLGIAAALVVRLLTNDWVPGWTATIITILFLGGIQLVCTGVLGEYIGRTYMQSKGRPLYVVRQILSTDRSAPQQIAESVEG